MLAPKLFEKRCEIPSRYEIVNPFGCGDRFADKSLGPYGFWSESDLVLARRHKDCREYAKRP